MSVLERSVWLSCQTDRSGWEWGGQSWTSVVVQLAGDGGLDQGFGHEGGERGMEEVIEQDAGEKELSELTPGFLHGR